MILPSARPRMRAARGVRAFTMVEMLVVIVILGMLFAMSTAAYVRMSRSYKEQGAASDLDIALRVARNSAVSANAPAYVQIDMPNRRVVPWSYKIVGLWHFEEVSGYGKSNGPLHDATLRGAESHKDGKIGKCVLMRPNSCIDVTADPDFDCEDGGYLEAYVRPTTYGFTGDNYIFSKLGAYSLKVGTGGQLIGEAGGTTVRSKTYRMVPGRWTKVAFAWNPQHTLLMVDDGLVGVGEGGKPPINDHPLLIGHDSASILGLIDEVRVMALTAGRQLALPPGAKLEHNTAPWNGVYFGADGGLDMRYHAGTVNLALIQNSKIRRITVSMLGITSRLEVENEAKQELEPETVTTTGPTLTNK